MIYTAIQFSLFIFSLREYDKNEDSKRAKAVLAFSALCLLFVIACSLHNLNFRGYSPQRNSQFGTCMAFECLT